VADTLSLPCYSTAAGNLTANDGDPESNSPLALVSIVRTAGDATAAVASGSSVNVNAGFSGQWTFTYTVRDSLNATSTGQLTVTATGTPAYCQANIK
jgi:uncharacterized cupin superfamily protein